MKIFFKKLIIIIILGCLSIIGWKCNIINPAEPIPAYITIDSASLKTNYDSSGSASQKITDAWVVINSEDLGVYEMPKHFPVLANGPTKIVINAGVLNNGSLSTRVIYPFYYPDTLTLNLKSKQNYTINPVFRYRTPTKFLLNEDFEQAGTHFVKVAGDTDMMVVTDPSKVFEGKGCGLIHLDSTHASYVGATVLPYYFPNNAVSSSVYIEMNYNSDMVFQVGIEFIANGIDETFYEWTINPKYKWNKIYLNLTDIIQSLGGGNYRILINADKSIAPGIGNLYLDNIKLLTI